MRCERDTIARRAVLEKALLGTTTSHHIILNITAGCMCLAVAISLWLILQHAVFYTRPYEQKHIMRILFMIPFSVLCSFYGFIFYRHAVYFDLFRDCYEAFAVVSFFTLLCHYVAPTLHDQKEYFRHIQPKGWIFPLNRCRKPRSGLTWFNIILVSISQCWITRPIVTIIAAILESRGKYCESSKQVGYAHIWLSVIQFVGITIAMYCVAQFYKQLKDDLMPYKPFPKLLVIKLATFFCFWQNWLVELLVARRVLHRTQYIAEVDIHIGYPCALVCFEMVIFAGLCHAAFPWKPYAYEDQDAEYVELVTAILEALNPWDYIKAYARAARWVFHGASRREQDSSYLPEKFFGTAESDYGVSKAKTRTTAYSEPVTGVRKRSRKDGSIKGRRTN